MTFLYFSLRNPSLVAVRQGVGWVGPFVCCCVTVLRQCCDNLEVLSVLEYITAASWHDFGVCRECIIINLQTSNVHKTGRNFSGQLWGEFFQPLLWGCVAVVLFPLQNKGTAYWRWDALALGFYWQIRKLWEWLKNQKGFFFPQWGSCLGWKFRLEAAAEGFSGSEK